MLEKKLPVQEMASKASHNLFFIITLASPLDTQHPPSSPYWDNSYYLLPEKGENQSYIYKSMCKTYNLIILLCQQRINEICEKFKFASTVYFKQHFIQ